MKSIKIPIAIGRIAGWAQEHAVEGAGQQTEMFRRTTKSGRRRRQINIPIANLKIRRTVEIAPDNGHISAIFGEYMGRDGLRPDLN
ncbi:hypothetical protein [Burkholderia sp. L27(2015)]|uniref:hypothetical protein n=1 Tax=Burkholderia sp. L27(2015) TaxID=1641858 RepID=UPI00131AE12B|nr:hypothetical protein [Burkholderia sp. L27(2015)]